MLKRIKPYLTPSNGILAIALLVTCAWVWGTVEAIQKNFVLQQQVDMLAQENAFDELQNETLKFQQKYYQTNEYLELSARERLNKALPDEKLLLLPANTVASTSEIEIPQVTPIAQRSNFQQWMYFLFGDKRL